MTGLIKGEQLVPGSKYKIDNFTGYFKEQIYWDKLYYVFVNVTKDKDKIPVLHFSSNHKFKEIKN